MKKTKYDRCADSCPELIDLCLNCSDAVCGGECERYAKAFKDAIRSGSVKGIMYKGETHLLTEWSEITGIPLTTLTMRLKRGWSVERTLGTPSPSGVKTTEEGS